MHRTAVLALALLCSAAPALADPPAMCSKLGWPLDKERALLDGTVIAVPSGDTRKAMPTRALSLMLEPGAKVTLPLAPAKPADPAKFAGFVVVPVTTPGDYLISLSSEGWIDAVQNGVAVTSSAHTGDSNCPGLRKSVRFSLAAGQLTIQISNAPSDRIEIAITPAP